MAEIIDMTANKKPVNPLAAALRDWADQIEKNNISGNLLLLNDGGKFNVWAYGIDNRVYQLGMLDIARMVLCKALGI